MPSLYDAIAANPEPFTWAFVAVNALWVAFAYFNKKRHERDLEALRHAHALEFEQRRSLFEARKSQYERYYGLIDDFGKSYQSEMLNKVQPIFEKYFSAMLHADSDSRKSEALSTFSGEMMALTEEGSKDYIKLQAETRSLKLVASDELIDLLDDLDRLMKTAMDSSFALIQAIPNLILTGKSGELQDQQSQMSTQGETIKAKADEVLRQMRHEMRKI